MSDHLLPFATGGIGPRKVVGFVPISLEALRDIDLTGQYDHLYPDRNPWPQVVLFPNVERARLALVAARSTLRRARWRLADTWGVLLHGLPEHDEEYDW